MRLALRQAIDVYALDREREALLNELTILSQLSRAMYRELDLTRLLDVLLDAAHSELGFDGAALLFFDDSGRRLDWAGVRPAGDDVAEHLAEIEINSSSASDFIEQIKAGAVQALSIDQIDDLEAPIARWVNEVSADEIMVVPLVGKDRAIGALAIDNRRGGRRFGADDRTLLDGLATQAVVAIENAQLVDDLRRSRAQVLRGDRLGTLGTLAAGLAHEINNPLATIHTFLNLAPEKRDSEDAGFWDDYHDQACMELERIRDLIATMAKLGRGGSEAAPAVPVDLAQLARNAVTLMEREARAADVTLSLDVRPGSSVVQGVRAQLHQVLLNLMLNAIQATPSAGEIAIRIGPDAGGDSQLVVFEVEDSGPGIAQADLEHIFDPFFATEDSAEGTGLGLMICHRIVSDHAGQIDVRSQQDGGTTFTVQLPASIPPSQSD
jgi:signal transduction histidine kinase